MPQGPSPQQFGNDIGRALVHAYVVNGNDVGMIQQGGRAGFQFEPAQTVAVLRHRWFQYFNGDVAPQAVIGGAINLAHSSGAYLFQHSIVAQSLSDHFDVVR